MIKAASLKYNKNIPYPPLLFAVKQWKFHLVPSKQETKLIRYPKALTEPAFTQGILSQVKLVSVTVRNSEDGIQSSPREQRQKPQLKRSHLLALIKGLPLIYPDFFSLLIPLLLCCQTYFSAISSPMGDEIRQKDHLSQFLAVLSLQYFFF